MISNNKEECIINNSDMSGWADIEQINKNFNLCSQDKLDGMPVGIYLKKIICIPKTYNSTNGTFVNNNLFVLGGAGDGVKRSVIIPHCLEYMKQGQSLIIADSKNNLCEKLLPAAEHYGYKTKKLICQPEYIKSSDGWDCLKPIKESDDPVITANMFANIIVKNTENPLLNNPKFWEELDENLLLALMLYVTKSPEWVPLDEKENAKRNIKEVYALLLTGLDTVEQIFEKVKNTNPKDLCITAYERWHNNEQHEQSFSNLATRLSVLQNDYVSDMLSKDDIDIKNAGKEKTIFFVMTDDQNSSYQLISSLFLSFAFYELVKTADKTIYKALDVPVQFMLNEFPSCGIIPNFPRNISMLCLKNIGVTICSHGIEPLKHLYPYSEWENILNNCANKLILGTNEMDAATYFSEAIGSSSECKVLTPEVEVSIKRKLLKPEEIIGMSNDRQIIIAGVSGCIVDSKKYDISIHPDSELICK